MSKTYWRPIEVEGGSYLWYVLPCKDVLVRAATKGSLKHRFTPEQVARSREERRERPDYYWDDDYGPAVGPGDVARFVREQLLGLPPMPTRPLPPRPEYPATENPWSMPGGDQGGYAVLLDVHRNEGTRVETVLVSLHDDPAEAKRRAALLDVEMTPFVRERRTKRAWWKPWCLWRQGQQGLDAFQAFREEHLVGLAQDEELSALRFRAVEAKTVAEMGLAVPALA